MYLARNGCDCPNNNPPLHDIPSWKCDQALGLHLAKHGSTARGDRHVVDYSLGSESKDGTCGASRQLIRLYDYRLRELSCTFS